jgi:predicted Zn-ribbon and HTH transcriptional regulator
MYLFSGGAAETSLKYEAIASTVTQCISTLELTKLGSYLDGDRVNYSAHILEREWKGKSGQGHPTGLMTMNVAGLKGDCLPQIFHLHAARCFFDDLIKPVIQQDAEKIKGKAMSSCLENNLNEDDLLDLFKVDIPTLTAESINEAGVSEEHIYDFLMDKISEMNESGAEVFERQKKQEDVSSFIEKVINTFSQAGDETMLTSGNPLKCGFVFYERVGSLLEKKIANVTDNISRLEELLFEGTNQSSLNNLLDRLATVTKKKKGVGELVVKLGGQSPTVSLVNQIMDVASKIQQQKKDKYNHLLLKHIYDSLSKFLREKHDALTTTIFKYSRLITQIDREVDRIKRTGRSTFTYNKQKFEEVTEHLMAEMYSRLNVVSTQEIMAKYGSEILPSEQLDEEEWLGRVLEMTQPDLNELTKVVDDLFCEDPKVYDYVETMLGQFFMTLKLDRDRFPGLETSQSTFAICTKKFYEKYRDDLFEGCSHLETENPFNVIVTKHEEGFPFISLSYFHRINEDFKELRGRGESATGHIMSDLDEKLPLLDG